MTSLDLEAEYNNRARVPEYPEIAKRWERAAQAYRSIAHAGLNLPYGPTPRQKCDIYHPDGGMRADTPLVVYIHGGYWQRGEREQYAHVAGELNQIGIAVALPSYDLCPAVRVGDIIGQIQDCLVMLWRHTGRRPVVTGHSAGGHLTAAMLAIDWSAVEGVPADLVRAGYAISGVFDVTPLIGTSLNEALGLTAEEAALVSVHDAVPHRTDIEFVAAVGGAESSEFIRQSRDMAAAWSAHGCKAEATIIRDANHFTIVDELTRPDSPMLTRIAALARTYSTSE
jgi:arylformamidase